MSKHTPGPWKWEAGDPAIEGPNGGAVCHIAQHANVRTGMATGEDFNSADARLIAAAPTTLHERDELLSALKRMLTPGFNDAEDARDLIRRIEGDS